MQVLLFYTILAKIRWLEKHVIEAILFFFSHTPQDRELDSPLTKQGGPNSGYGGIAYLP